MSNLDIGRIVTERSRYAWARLQQGRPILDADLNAAASGVSHDVRDALLAVLGNTAGPADGFFPDLRVGDVLPARLVRFGSLVEAYVLDFMLQPGTHYAGGMRFELDAPEPAIFQRGFLQMGPGTAPLAALGVSRQFLILRGFEQAVTAYEDRELMEPALGGADTTGRVIRRARVETYAVDAATCAEAFDEVIERLTADGGATYRPATAALASNARLRIGFAGDDGGDCAACRPSLAGRYLGAEPHTLRIMLATPSRFVWAMDTPPLYRAKLVLEGAGVARIEMLTPPKDETLRPRHGQVVELIPFAALLKNGAPGPGKVAGQKVRNETIASPVGFFAEAIAPFDPASHTLTVRLSAETLAKIGLNDPKGQADPQAAAQKAALSGTAPADDVIALEWDPAHPQAGELNPSADTDAFTATLFMRLWQQAASGEVSIPITATVPLGRTGIVPNFSGPGIPGDHWSVAVSPLANDRVVPSALMGPDGASPDGPHRVIAPLALLEWESSAGYLHTLQAIADCRPALPTIADRGCTTLWVGLGEDGDTASIQDAIDRLPASGGRISILPGVYREEIRIEGRQNVIVEGCGPETVIASPEDAAQPALVEAVPSPAGYLGLTVRNLALEARGQAALQAAGERIRIAGITATSEAGEAGDAESAVRILDGARVSITGATLRMAPSASPAAALYLHAPGGARVADCRIEAAVGEDGGAAWGGIHLAGGSVDVQLLRNAIAGGRGHGITLGSVRWRARNGLERRHQGAGIGQSAGAAPFAATGRLVPQIFDPAEDDPVAAIHYPDAEPPLRDLVIRDNTITGMGGAAIGALAIQLDHDEAATGPPLCIRERVLRVRNADIVGNTARGNVTLAPDEPALPQVLGAIALSAARNLSLRNNTVEDNGRGIGLPVCGIYVGEGARLQIAGNRLARNGDPDLAARGPAMLGGGIVLSRPAPLDLAAIDAHGPAITTAMVADNVVVQSDGPALFAMVAGTIALTGNHFESEGVSGALSLPQSTTVVVVALGPPAEAIEIPPDEPNPDRWRQPAGSQDYLTGHAQTLGGPSGDVLFAANTVLASGQQALRDAAIIPVFLATTGALTVDGNTITARTRRLIANAMLIGATVNASGNHFAETADATEVSLAAASPLIANVADTVSTHCTAVYAGPNDGNPDYVRREDNLVLLTPPQGCREAGAALNPMFDTLIARFFRPSQDGPVG